jgi:hypothetical protein
VKHEIDSAENPASNIDQVVPPLIDFMIPEPPPA